MPFYSVFQILVHALFCEVSCRLVASELEVHSFKALLSKTNVAGVTALASLLL